MSEVFGKLFHFGSYTLDLRRGCLRCDDRDVELRPKSFDVLRYLVQNAGRLVPKDELIEAVWPNVAVTDDSLTRCVCDVRCALQDTAQRVIKTVQRRGYLLAAAVSTGTAAVFDPQYAATAPSNPSVQPDPVSAPSPSGNNLPRRLAAMIGREAELVELQESIAHDRLVTLAGPGGVGKSRLAIELGWRMIPLFADGVWQIDLAPLRDPACVASAVAAVLGDADASIETIATANGKQRKLLIFDNCEHMAAAVAGVIGKLLERTAQLSVLVTSQEVLGIPAEQVYRLNPLALPAPSANCPRAEIGALAEFGAVALFVERARAADRRFALDDSNAASVVEICRRLDGIPLALEMAAARLPLLGVEGLRARLDERLKMLSAGPRTPEARHRTLRDTAAWSYGLLEAADQQVFCRLAAFAGSFSLEAAIAIAGGDAASDWDVVHSLGRLVDKSLITVEHGERPRYRLLETLRLYAAELLAASGEGLRPGRLIHSATR